jgi:hypothetical protein
MGYELDTEKLVFRIVSALVDDVKGGYGEINHNRDGNNL